MKNKLLLTMSTVFSALMLFKTQTFAAEAEGASENLGTSLSLIWCIPFACMLLCIAIMPLVAGEWWEKHKQWGVAFWSLLFLVPFAFCYGFGTMGEHLLEVIIGDYLTFIILLFALFCVAGNISLEGDLVGKPIVNVVLLLIGTLLSSWIGTTGASMLMIRPIIKANKWRRRKVQIIVFFIFLVSNIGGCLTPVGDPPLLMGFMNGVSFFWSLRLITVMLVNMVILLVVFFCLDMRAYKKDIADGRVQPVIDKEHKNPIKLKGAHNIIFLVMIVGAVILSGTLPKINPVFSQGIDFCEGVTLSWASIIEIVIMLVASFLSFKTTNKKVRKANNFTWDAIQEVAILFVGIFITMIPALLILKARGSELGLSHPAQYFWITGLLSSFLDNTPTYLVFFTTAASSGFTEGISTAMGIIPETMLMAISCGAVFMGANTYIGNAPNFMVKSIAEENGIKMPSFVGYLAWSVTILIPTFFIDMLIFFL
jgi:Na+/H+ antiporter NhaD/arsenite permease-like protein